MPKEKSQEDKDELSEKRVFSIKHSEIPKGSSQCEMDKHKFVKHSENEIFCPICQSIYIVENTNDYV